MFVNILNKVKFAFYSRSNRSSFSQNLLLVILLPYIIEYIYTLNVKHDLLILTCLNYILSIILIYCFIKNFPLLVKRLHDIDRSGFYIIYLLLGIFVFVLLIGIIVSIFNCGIAGMQIAVMTFPFTYICFLLFHIFLMFKKGTDGANRYGEPPNN